MKIDEHSSPRILGMDLASGPDRTEVSVTLDGRVVTGSALLMLPPGARQQFIDLLRARGAYESAQVFTDYLASHSNDVPSVEARKAMAMIRDAARGALSASKAERKAQRPRWRQ